MKTCVMCLKEKPAEDFAKSSVNKSGLQSYCRPCVTEYARIRRASGKGKKSTIEQNRRAFLKYTYGITLERFGEMVEEQDSKCKVCSEPLALDMPRQVHIDHDHNCCATQKTCGNCIRGLLCRRCNLLVGVVESNLGLLAVIMDYANLTHSNLTESI